MNQIFFVLEAEPSAAQAQQCSSVRKAYALEKWLCTISADGNCTLFDLSAAMTAAQARTVVHEEGWNPPVQ